MKATDNILIAGARGMVGRAIHRALIRKGYENIFAPSRSEVDFRDYTEVSAYMLTNRINVLFMAAAKVGGILANKSCPVEFFTQNMLIQTTTIMAAAANHHLRRLIFLGSSCIYPANAENPIKESALLSGPLEPTNDAYAIAKIAGIRMVRAYQEQMGKDWNSVMPCNLYGPWDNYHPADSHVVPGMIRKFDDAKCLESHSVKCWGSGKPRRELLHVDDLAEALLICANHYHEPEPINIGAGYDIAINALAEGVADAVGFTGNIYWDNSKPDGVMKKLIDSTKIIRLGWEPRIRLPIGLKKTYEAYLDGQGRK